MIEPMMYMGIGLLLAGLIGVAFLPLVHCRAVRLTVRRLEATLPHTTSEILADKDLLRSEFAMATRRLETMIETQRNRNASQLIELSRKSDVINRLKLELNTLKMAAAKVVAAYSNREPIGQKAGRFIPQKTRRRYGDITRLVTALTRRRSSVKASRVCEPSRRAS